jgi:alkylhydroperoxidase/carboxymuconolactone decarboxylase family protein YurZ/predicted MFS family arabinose efflux permease
MLFSLAAGASVGNLYWAQPILGEIVGALGVSPGSSGLLVTLTQIGYAVGVFLLVPLGDTVNRKRIIPALMILCSAALAGSALAPNFAVLLVALALVGVTTVAGQLLIPLAGDLARADQRGRTVGTVASGILLGILISRTVSGIVADIFGWRAVYVAAAAIMLILAVLMASALPHLAPPERVPYGKLLRSVLAAVAQHRTVRVVMLIGAATMCVFTAFWTGMTFLLAAAPFSYSASQIGLVSLVGILGAVAAQRTGPVFDRGWAVPAIGVGLAITLVALAVSGLGASSIIAVLIAGALFSIGLQSVQVLAQTMMLSIDPAARSRLNTALVVGNFVGGALGSTLAAVLWQLGGWRAIMGGSAVITGLALAVWFIHRNGALTRLKRAEPGDPAKLAAALARVAAEDNPPTRWIAGEDAVAAIRGQPQAQTRTDRPLPRTLHNTRSQLINRRKETMTEENMTPMQRMMGDFAPTFVSLTDDVLFGQVWSRPELSRRDRSLITISSLVSAGNIEQLEAHIPMGIANGLTEDEIKEAITHVAFYAGWPRAVSALTLAQRLFTK